MYHETQERVRKTNKKWLQEQGAVELLEICAKSCSSSIFKKATCELATIFFMKELDQFISTGDISQSSTMATEEAMTSFLVHTLSKTMMRRVPLLSHLFQGLVADNTKKIEMPTCDQENVLEFSDEEEEMTTEGKPSKVAQRREKRQTNRCHQKYPVFSNMASGTAKRTLYLPSATCFHDSLVLFSPVIAIAFMLHFSIWCSYLSMSVRSKIQST